MKINQVKQYLKGMVEKNVPVATLIVGTMGMGKSQLVKQVADELKIGFIDLRLAQQEPGDLIGIPYQKEGRTYWAKPNWFPEDGTKGILFLDEINRAPNDVRQAVFQLVLDKKMHTHTLPSGWAIVSAMNPSNGAYQVEDLDPAMVRRFSTVVLEPDTDAWLKWADKNSVHHSITSFINAHNDMLCVQEQSSIETKPSADGYRMLSCVMQAGVIPEGCEAEIYKGLIGKEQSLALLKYQREAYNKPVSGSEILKDYPKVKAKVLAQKVDATFITIKELLRLVDTGAQEKLITTDEVNNVEQFILDSKAEFQASMIKGLNKEILKLLIGRGKITQIIMKIMNGGTK
jgi:hypothetical protein